jgi:AraC-like DNA-binding protein
MRSINLSNLKTCLYLFKGTFAYLGKLSDTDFHSHHALQISISLNNPFILETENGLKKYQAVIIDTDVVHKFDGMDDWHLILLIDPEHENVSQIKTNILFEQTAEPAFDLLESHVDVIVQLMIKEATCNAVNNSLNSMLTLLSGSNQKICEKDHRIRKIINYVESLDEKKVSIKTLTNLVNLSESRLSHLFKNQTGIPVRRYILWVRLMGALKSIVSGQSMTNAALSAGFSDSAHFNRTFRNMFGVFPSTYVKKRKNSRFIQLIDCSG